MLLLGAAIAARFSHPDVPPAARPWLARAENYGALFAFIAAAATAPAWFLAVFELRPKRLLVAVLILLAGSVGMNHYVETHPALAPMPAAVFFAYLATSVMVGGQSSSGSANDQRAGLVLVATVLALAGPFLWELHRAFGWLGQPDAPLHPFRWGRMAGNLLCVMLAWLSLTLADPALTKTAAIRIRRMLIWQKAPA